MGLSRSQLDGGGRGIWPPRAPPPHSVAQDLPASLLWHLLSVFLGEVCVLVKRGLNQPKEHTPNSKLLSTDDISSVHG